MFTHESSPLAVTHQAVSSITPHPEYSNSGAPPQSFSEVLPYQFSTILTVVVGLEETFLYASMGAFETCSCFACHTTILHTLPFFHFRKAAKALLPVDEINNKLKNIVKSQGHSKNTIIKLNEEIQGIRTQISQVSCCKYFNLFVRFIRKRYFILKFS